MYTILLTLGLVSAGVGLTLLIQYWGRQRQQAQLEEAGLDRTPGPTRTAPTATSRQVRVIGSAKLTRVLNHLGLREIDGAMMLDAPTLDPGKQGEWQQDTTLLAVLQATVFIDAAESQLVGLIELEGPGGQNNLLLYSHSRLFIMPLCTLTVAESLRLEAEFNEAVDQHEGTVHGWRDRDWKVVGAAGGDWQTAHVKSQVKVEYLNPGLGQPDGPTSHLTPELDEGAERLYRQIILQEVKPDGSGQLAYGFEIGGTWHFADTGRELDPDEVRHMEAV